MPEILHKCSNCGAILDEEDLFCANCGTEAPGHADGEHGGTIKATNNFSCDGCGASMSYDASAQNLRCPFCGSEKLHAEKDAKVLAPEAICTFATSRDDAEAGLKRFMGSSFWRPGDLAKMSQITKLTQVYVPYWVFAATAHTHWTADTNRVPAGARASWYPIGGDHQQHYENVLVGASGALTPAETNALCPFDLAQAVPPEQVDLTNVVYEPFLVQRKYARPQAVAGFEAMERTACQALVPGSARNVHVAVLLEGLTSQPVLLPVWIMAYQYRDKTYRFLVNGQTGRHTGEAPFSYTKLAAVIGITVGVLLLSGLAGLICSGIAAMSR
jgi:DNA-directed RNA polymerase subunit RPC12/RpoP